MECIAYKKGYGYQLQERYALEIPVKPDQDIHTDYIVLTTEGRLTIQQGYAWDGPSGPAFDTHNFMRASLVHDALYQLIRDNHLLADRRNMADRLLQRMCREDGMSGVRAWWVYVGVRFGGGPSVDPSSRKPVRRAPGHCT